MKVTVNNSFGHVMMGPEHCHLVIEQTHVSNRPELERLIRRLRRIASGLWDKPETESKK